MAEEYCTLDELKSYLAAGSQLSNANDGSYRIALAAAHKAVDNWCGRTFIASTSTSARVFIATDLYTVNVDDFWDSATLGVATDAGGDGTFETTVATNSIQLEPLNGRVGGITGHAYTKLRYVNGGTWPTPVYGRANVQVTAKWGWAAVPDEVKSVTLEVAKDIAMSASFRAGAIGFGDGAIARIRDTPSLVYRLQDFQHPDKLLLA